MIDEPLIGWLQRLIDERISPEVKVRTVEGVWQLQLSNGEAPFIRMPVSSWPQGAAVMAHGTADIPGRSTPLPTPGSVGIRGPAISQTAQGAFLSYDVLGLAYWMLSRAEEVGRADLDGHQRFPARSSHAHRNGYLDRPVVDEWFDVLRRLARTVWPGLALRDLRFEMRLSHDVDRPSEYAFTTPAQLVRNIAGDLVRRRDFRAASRRPRAWLADSSLHPLDPFNTFDWIMDRSERLGLRSAFYFVCGRSDPARDPRYPVGHTAIRKLMRNIHRRGHEIGLHPSYAAVQHRGALRGEMRKLLEVTGEEGIKQEAWGGRMHYLRWSTPATLYEWEEAGLSYDSTLGYADQAGFRCGTCFEYPAFDPVARKTLGLRIRPLVAMEATVMADAYMGLGATREARDFLVRLKDRCRAVGGWFTLLWHNSELDTPAKRSIYEAVLEA